MDDLQGSWHGPHFTVVDDKGPLSPIKPPILNPDYDPDHDPRNPFRQWEAFGVRLLDSPWRSCFSDYQIKLERQVKRDLAKHGLDEFDGAVIVCEYGYAHEPKIRKWSVGDIHLVQHWLRHAGEINKVGLAKRRKQYEVQSKRK